MPTGPTTTSAVSCWVGTSTVDELGLLRRGRAAATPVPRCGQEVDLVRSVEAAHTFQLGTVYSSVMPGGSFVAEDGEEAFFSMGCYGMGVSRLLAVVAEECHDDRGLVWPAALAPFQVHLLALGAGRSPEVAEAADALHDRLVAAGVDVLYDDRDVSPGVKFADADLIGVPDPAGGRGQGSGPGHRGVAVPGHRRGAGGGHRRPGGGPARRLTRESGGRLAGPAVPVARSPGHPIRRSMAVPALLYFSVCRSVGV